MMNKSPLETIHDLAKDMHSVGLISARRFKEYEVLCLPKVKELKPEEIKKIRLHEKLSQAVFAKLLNTSLSTVQHWEQGQKHPRGATLKLLNLVSEKGIDILV